MVGLVCALAVGANAEDAPSQTIERLLLAVGRSECTFLRNGKAYSAEDAEKHLRLKYRRGKRYAKTAEHFIDRLASKSSWSGQPYRLQCGDEPPRLTSDWLHETLDKIRASNST